MLSAQYMQVSRTCVQSHPYAVGKRDCKPIQSRRGEAYIAASQASKRSTELDVSEASEPSTAGTVAVSRGENALTAVMVTTSSVRAPRVRWQP